MRTLVFNGKFVHDVLKNFKSVSFRKNLNYTIMTFYHGLLEGEALAIDNKIVKVDDKYVPEYLARARISLVNFDKHEYALTFTETDTIWWADIV